MKNLFISLFALVMTGLLISCAGPYKRDVIHPARPGDLSYKTLHLNDFEQMQAAVRKHIRHAKQDFAQADEDPEAENAAFAQLKQALKLIFSRPDSDNIVAKLIPDVRRELAVYGAYSKMIMDLTKEGIQAFDKSLGVNTLTLATYTFMLQNIIGEIKAEAKDNADFRLIIEAIAKADLKIPQDVIQERKLSGMFLSESPSSQAKRALN